jgi:hypothetical protein
MSNLLFILFLAAQISVTVNRYDSATTSWNGRETVLTPTRVNAAGFGKLYSYYVDGSVFAQPLYLPGVAIAGHGTHNVLYVATGNDKVYAFDAGKPGAPLWMRSLTDEMAGTTPVPVTDITNNNDLNVVGNVGIMSTPVIDPAANAIYLLARMKDNGKYAQRLYKMDVRSGKDLVAPATIEAAVNGGALKFDPKGGNQRPSLANARGAVVIAWASHEDIRPYHGWVMAYDRRDLKQIAVMCTTPDGADGGIWQSGRGPAVDPSGAIYFETGNGDWDGQRNFGTSLIKLRIHGNAFVVEDYFTPHDYQQLNDRDADLGSSGPMLVPGTNFLIAGSKKGIVYVLDTGKLGHMTPEGDAVLQTLDVKGGRIMAGPAFWDGPTGGTLFLWSETDFLKSFRFADGRLDPTPLAKGAIGNRGSPGGTLTLSSNGKQAGTGIVWATHTNNKSADHGNAPGVLRAFDAESLQELWNSEQRAKRDRLGTLVKFVPPLVVDGRVYVPNYDNAVNVYGVLDQ